jgi:SprA family protein
MIGLLFAKMLCGQNPHHVATTRVIVNGSFMKTEIVQTTTILQKVGGKPCKECQEEKAQQKLQEQTQTEADRVSLSGVSALETGGVSPSAEGGTDNNGAGETPGANNQVAPRTEADLSQEERQALTELKTRDREVRAHEQAHLGAAGPYAKGPPSFEFQTGPDGKPYAVGGEVQIDTSEISGNPEATLVKAQTIKRAATAPANPSAQDRQVAAQASRMEIEARKEIQEQRTEEAGSTPPASGAGPTAPIKEAQQTSKASQSAPGEASSNTTTTSISDASSRIPNILEKFSDSAVKGQLLDIIS